MSLSLTFRQNALTELNDVEAKDRGAILEELARLQRQPEGHGQDIVRVQSNKALLRLKVRRWRVFFVREAATIDVYAVRRRRGDNETYRQMEFAVSPTPLVPEATFSPELFDDPDDVVLLHPPMPGEDEQLPVPLTLALLVTWNIPDQYHPAFEQCRTADDLLSVPAPPDVTEAVLSRLYPKSVDEISTQARYEVHSPEELEAFLDGRVTDLLLHLDDEQRDVAHWHLDRPTLIRGGPGTGKTVVALYRTLHLIERNPGLRVLYTTYTTTLAHYAEQLLSRLLAERGLTAKLEVKTVDRVMNDFAGRGLQLDQGDRGAREALKTVVIRGADPLLDRLGLRYLLDEFHEVIDGWGLSTLADYQAANRQGRRLPLMASDREIIWRHYQLWRRALDRAQIVTWPQRRVAALRHAIATYDAVIVDEAQGLSPIAIRFLRRLANDPQHFTLAADTNQSLYQRGTSWKAIDSALDMRGKTAVLHRTYRSTQELHAVLQDLAAHPLLDLAELPEAPARQGVKPILLKLPEASDYAALIRVVLEQCRRLRIPLSGVGVLTTSNVAAENVVSEFNARAINAVLGKNSDLDLDYPAIKVMTLHSAKGLEFPLVVLLDINEGQLPRQHTDVPEEERTNYESNDLKLLFVGVSRAMRQLVVTCDMGRPSRFLASIGVDRWEQTAP